jgi:hypothetical protein
MQSFVDRSGIQMTEFSGCRRLGSRLYQSLKKRPRGVTPAKAGGQNFEDWIPAYAGMTLTGTGTLITRPSSLKFHKRSQNKRIKPFG